MKDNKEIKKKIEIKAIRRYQKNKRKRSKKTGGDRWWTYQPHYTSPKFVRGMVFYCVKRSRNFKWWLYWM